MTRTPTCCSWARARASRRTSQGEPFVGRAGRLLTSLIEGIGLTRDDGVHRQRREVPPARQPRPAARSRSRRCRPYLEAQVAFIDPKVVVTLGNFATKLLLDTKDGITKLRGQRVPVPRRRGAHPRVPPVGGAAQRRHRARPGARRLRRGQARARAGDDVADDAVARRRTPPTRPTRSAQRVGALLRAGDVVVLDGELGTGKTVFAKGIAVALGITEPVVSPTFTVVREYDAPDAARARRRVPPRPPAGAARPRVRRPRRRATR